MEWFEDGLCMTKKSHQAFWNFSRLFLTERLFSASRFRESEVENGVFLGPSWHAQPVKRWETILLDRLHSCYPSADVGRYLASSQFSRVRNNHACYLYEPYRRSTHQYLWTIISPSSSWKSTIVPESPADTYLVCLSTNFFAFRKCLNEHALNGEALRVRHVCLVLGIGACS